MNPAISYESDSVSPEVHESGSPGLAALQNLKTKKSKANWFTTMPGGIRNALLGAVSVVGLLLLFKLVGAGGDLLFSSTNYGDPISVSSGAENLLGENQSEPSEPTEEQAVEVEDPSLTAPSVQEISRQQFDDVQSANIRLSQEVSGLLSEIRQSRAVRWNIHAQNKCLEAPDCTDPYSWLTQQYELLATDILQEIQGGTMPTDSETIDQFTLDVADLLDISAALAMNPQHQQPRFDVITLDLTEQIQELLIEAEQYSAAGVLEEFDRRHDQIQEQRTQTPETPVARGNDAD